MQPHTQPITAGQMPDSVPGHPMLPSAPRLAAILGGIPETAALPAGQTLLLTVENGIDPALPPLPGWAVYRIPVGAGAGVRRSAHDASAQAEPLPFADASFAAICMYGGILQMVRQPRLLNKVQRMLRPGGVAVLIEPLTGFNFTTFPIGGPAYLLRRQLLQAGLRRVRALPEHEGLLVFLAERGSSTRLGAEPPTAEA